MKIGDYARLCGLSVDTLRYYSKIGLYKEDYISDSGYRFYDPNRLNVVEMIIWLRENDIPLAGIKELMETGSLELAGMFFDKKSKDIEQQIAHLEEELRNCQFFYNEFKDEGRELGKSHLKKFDDRFCTTNRIPLKDVSYSGYRAMLQEVKRGYVDRNTFCNSLWGGLLLFDEDTGAYASEICVAVFNTIGGNIPMPGGTYAVLPYFGFYDEAVNYLDLLLQFIGDNGLTPGSDCFLVGIWEEGPNHDVQHKTIELQIRVGD